MSKLRTVFVCQGCGFQATRWMGKCPDCQEWNTLVEERLELAPAKERGTSAATSGPQPITEVQPTVHGRYKSGIDELDRVLGGGIVPGSVVLIGGDPGIGKSTLVLQALAALARDGIALYVSGEESPQQVKLRADRLGVSAPQLLVLAETALEGILEHARRIDEPAADLGAIVAVASSFLDRPVDPSTLILGEVGLAGEVRAVGQVETRVREGAKLGFKRCVIPEGSRRQMPEIAGVEVRGVQSLREAWDILL